ISWERIEYCAGTNEYVAVEPGMKEAVLEHYRENPEQARQQFGDEPFELKNILDHWVRSTVKDFHVIPTDTVYVTIDKEAVRRSGMMMASDSLPDKMVISLKGKGALYKGDLMMLELIANSNWDRPIYVATTVGQENYMNLGENFVQEGLANRITPFHTHDTNSRGDLVPVKGVANFDTEKVYDNVMNKYKYGNVKQEGIYLDETVTRMCYTHRRLLATLAVSLIDEGKTDQAKKVLEKCEQELPASNVPHDYAGGSLDLARAYSLTGQKQKAQQLVDQLWKKSQQYLMWYCSLDGYRFSGSQRDCQIQFLVMNHLLDLQTDIDEKKADQRSKELDALAQLYYSKGGSFGQ
ncbi:MAG: tetratricopeptide repeat protein, partial [Bacteroidales bacterium]|nr:tetratricopeptide repeat protein [Bacteroidales bacterium]